MSTLIYYSDVKGVTPDTDRKLRSDNKSINQSISLVYLLQCGWIFIHLK